VSRQIRVTRTRNRLILDVYSGESPKMKRPGMVQLVPQPSMPWGSDPTACTPLNSRVNALFGVVHGLQNM
jgi:hypothetical protein